MPDEHENNIALSALENLRKRLLDLTARNRLINFRHWKASSLRVIDELPDQIVETLLTETEMRFLPVPEPFRKQLIEAGYIRIDEETGKDVRLKKDPSAQEWADWLGFDTSYEVPEPRPQESMAKHQDRAIQTMLFPYELEALLRKLRQKAESAIDETGANILYLALGFLEWSENHDSENGRLAPLFLVPCRLQKGRLNPTTKTYEYTLQYSGEDIISNLSLSEKLRVDFALALPELDEDTRPEIYFRKVLDLIRENRPAWRVRRYISLALLNFSQLLMYLDLDPGRWPEVKPITEHSLVKRLLAGHNGPSENEGSESDLGFGEEYPIDELQDVHERYPLIEDADSSQHSALVDALEGKNLVIEGPPGTGKSQTITNLIAAAMGQGKRVLFVAEKLAALEVVKRRLDAKGLGNFCLELHSHKSQKRKVLDEVSSRLRAKGHYRNPHEIEVDIARYEELKTALKYHAERINRPWKNTGMTLHQIFMAATRYREALGTSLQIGRPQACDGETFDAVKQSRAKDQVVAFSEVYRAVVDQLQDEAQLQSHPWYGLRRTDLQFFDLDSVRSLLQEWQTSLEALVNIRADLAIGMNCDQSEIPESARELRALLEDLGRLPKLEGDELIDSLPMLRGEGLDEAKGYLQLFEDIQDLYTVLAKKIGTAGLQDLNSVDTFLNCGEKLRQFVRGSVQFHVLSQTLQRLNRLQNKLLRVDKLVCEIQVKIGEEAGRHLSLSESGLQELKVFVETVAALEPTLWRKRDELFENDELDQVLLRIHDDLEALRALEEELKETYNLDSLRDQAGLEELRSIIDEGGPFRWFKGRWRAARKELLSHRASGQVNFSQMVSTLEKAADFAGGRQRFESDSYYDEVLGVRFKGMDTDLSTLESLRKWYRSVRQIYGLGFGAKASLGDAIIDMPSKFAGAIRSLSELEFGKKIEGMFEELHALRDKFAPDSDLHSSTALLVGDGGSITRSLHLLEEAIQGCEPLVTDNTMAIYELLKVIENLDSLRRAIANWSKTDNEISRLFKGRLHLQVGVGVDNEAALDIANRTLHVATCVDRKITTPVISRQLVAKPEKATFDVLVSLTEQLKSGVDNQLQKYTAFEKSVSLDFSDWSNSCGETLDGLIGRSTNALQHGEAFYNWLDYVRERDRLSAIGLGHLADGVERGYIRLDQILNAYYASTYDCLAREILREQPELARFSGHSQETLRRQFNSYDEKLKKLQCERIAWRIDQKKIPRGNSRGRVSEYTENSLLEHECGKKTRHLPIRQLLKRAGRALVSLKPCFMMGPMSVAQYLEPGQVDFDLLLMDEASQIKPQDALGAVARGTQMVVVGDPKQLPPTRFFDRVLDDEEEDPTAIEESESILDTARPMFQGRRLRWHYRSQHESLIAFSNHSFYDGNLVLFPSPHHESEGYGIRYRRLQRGYFLNRRNLEEAKEIAESVRQHFTHRSNETLGVVAMSAEQRDQIERSVEMLAKEDYAFQELLEADQARQESLFIKNLENVQGDERDVIFISMTYGPREAGGKVYQRFGPINSDVGWRRLNVLFTRSRKRMRVFSSMGSEDIVVDSSSRRGVSALRNFLSYCETGRLHIPDIYTDRLPDSDFEIAVAEKLGIEGFECVPQVGAAGFFIDIAVKDPGNPARYLMGIECDGATYHSAKSVRDRDRLRQTILERLGWRIRRIWSTDWFKNPSAELQPIVRELHQLKTSPSKEPMAEAQSTVDERAEKIEYEEDQEPRIDELSSLDGGLKERLIEFDMKVIRNELPDTPDDQRLLRPEMIEAFLEHLPLDKSEFHQFIPPYLRQSTQAAEGRFLERVLKIISAGMDEAYGLLVLWS